jgi:hypothetical protein
LNLVPPENKSAVLPNNLLDRKDVPIAKYKQLLKRDTGKRRRRKVDWKEQIVSAV